MYQLATSLNELSSHRLEDITEASLMNRTDTKFVFPFPLLPPLLSALQAEYTVLEISGNRLFTYENIYYDTNDFDLYHMHHSGKSNRYKVRIRKYLETQTSFFEVKTKTNKNRTIKNRIQVEATHPHTQKVKEFLKGEVQQPYGFLKPVQFNRYHRISLMHKTDQERVTFDFNISFQKINGNRVHQMNQFVIAELKQKRLERNSLFFKIMRQYNIKPRSFSKYCVGCCLIAPTQIKVNRFKPSLYYVNPTSYLIN